VAGNVAATRLSITFKNETRPCGSWLMFSHAKAISTAGDARIMLASSLISPCFFPSVRIPLANIGPKGQEPPGVRGASFGVRPYTASATRSGRRSRVRCLAASLTGGFVESDRVMPLGDHASLSGLEIFDAEGVAAASRGLPAGASPEGNRPAAEVFGVAADELPRAERAEQLRGRRVVEVGGVRVRLRHATAPGQRACDGASSAGAWRARGFRRQ